MHVKLREPINYGKEVMLEQPLLYNVEHDISEQYDVADKHPDIVKRLQQAIVITSTRCRRGHRQLGDSSSQVVRKAALRRQRRVSGTEWVIR